MSKYTLVTHSAKYDSECICVINTNNIEYVVKIAHNMLYSRDDHDKIEASQSGELLFVLGRRAGCGPRASLGAAMA